MNREVTQYARMLAVDPTPRGFAFAVVEANWRLIDWGSVDCPSGQSSELKERLHSLVTRYDPAVLVVEDYANSRRGSRARNLVQCFLAYAARLGIETVLCSRDAVIRNLGLPPTASKHATATAIAERFPELKHILPPKRKPWASEHSRMNVFDAVALANSVATAA